MYVELHDGVRDHPKILKLARDLGVPNVVALGHMCSLWTWALRMAPDGDLGSFDVEDIEIGAQWAGAPGMFVSSAISRKLLDKTEFGFVVHDWSERAGSLKTAKRVAAHRARRRAGIADDV